MPPPDSDAPADLPLPTTRISLLGVPAWRGARGEGLLPDPRAAALLAMVVLDGPQPRARVAALFWPQSQPTAARTNLRVLLHRLQQVLGERVFEGGDRLTLAPGVAVDLAGADVDLAEPGLRQGAGPCRLLHELTLDALPEVDDWLRQARQRVEQRQLRGLATLLSRMVDRGELARAAAAAEAMIELDPLSEIAYRELMRVCALRGDRAAALAAYERCRDVLRRQLGTSPDPQTSALHAEILRHRARPVNESAEPAPLLQRGHELAEIDRAGAAGEIVAVEGPGGSGKTALLQCLAERPGAFLWRVEAADAQAPLAGLLRLARHVRATLAAPALPSTLSPWRRATRGDQPTLRQEDLHLLAAGALQRLQHLHATGVRTVLIDDTHLLDDASLDVLVEVVQRLRAQAPWCTVVLAWRPARGQRKLRALCDRLAMEGRLALVHPAPLTPSAFVQLHPGLDPARPADRRLAEDLVARTGGTPAVLARLARLDAARLAASVREAALPPVRSLLQGRLHGCSATARGLAQLAAVAGPAFSAGLAAGIMGLSAWKVGEKWNELLLAGVFDAGGFAFPLLGEAVAESVPDSVRRFMHREVALELERQDRVGAEVARHWLQAGEPLRATRHARVAAQAELEAGGDAAAVAAIAHLRPSLRRADGSWLDHDPQALLLLAQACLGAGEHALLEELLPLLARQARTAAQRAAVAGLRERLSRPAPPAPDAPGRAASASGSGRCARPRAR